MPDWARGARTRARNLQAHWVLAWTLAALERKAEAAEEFRKVIELAPEGDMKNEAQAALERVQ